MQARQVVLSMLLTSLPLLAVAAEAPGIRLYRYVDNRGVTVLDTQGVPPEYVAKGYQVLNQQGRVLQTIAPAPSAGELKAREAQQAQQAQDQALLDRYPSLLDLDRDKARRQADLDSQVGLANNNLAMLRQRQASLEQQAASLERTSQPVPDALLGQISDVRKRQLEVQQHISEYQQQRQQLGDEYEIQRVRLSELLEGK